jgi:uncharacterized protein (DUF697 family)
MADDNDDAAGKIQAAHRLKADNCIKNHVIAAMGLGMAPSFAIEVVGVTGIEVKMIRDLAEIYEFPVPHKLVAYKILISVIGSILPFYLAARMRSAVKGLPLFGHIVYAGFLSATNGAAVYAVGKIFQRHYESGGIFLSSRNNTIRSFFKEKYEEGKQIVPTLAEMPRTA